MVAALMIGCGDGLELVHVEGIVTMDAEPVANADVIFRPADGRPSIGKTDGVGHYVLHYMEGKAGAVPGTHQVTISTFVEADPDSSDPLVQQGHSETVPECYNTKTTLTADLKPHQPNTVDFPLESAKAVGLR
jgi:hypothetical protein